LAQALAPEAYPTSSLIWNILPFLSALAVHSTSMDFSNPASAFLSISSFVAYGGGIGLLLSPKANLAMSGIKGEQPAIISNTLAIGQLGWGVGKTTAVLMGKETKGKSVKTFCQINTVPMLLNVLFAAKEDNKPGMAAGSIFLAGYIYFGFMK